MPRYFVDTFYLVALSDPRDQWHARVLTFSRSLSDYHLYTVDEVLAEYLTFYSYSAKVSWRHEKPFRSLAVKMGLAVADVVHN